MCISARCTAVTACYPRLCRRSDRPLAIRSVGTVCASYFLDSDVVNIQHQLATNDVLLSFRALGILDVDVASFALLVAEISRVSDGPFTRLFGNQLVFNLCLQVYNQPRAYHQPQFLITVALTLRGEYLSVTGHALLVPVLAHALLPSGAGGLMRSAYFFLASTNGLQISQISPSSWRQPASSRIVPAAVSNSFRSSSFHSAAFRASASFAIISFACTA